MGLLDLVSHPFPEALGTDWPRPPYVGEGHGKRRKMRCGGEAGGNATYCSISRHLVSGFHYIKKND